MYSNAKYQRIEHVKTHFQDPFNKQFLTYSTYAMPSDNIAHLSHELIFCLYKQQLSKHWTNAQIS